MVPQNEWPIMLESIARGVAGLLFAVLAWVVLIPLMFTLATPVILLLVLCRGDGTFWDNLWDEYRGLWRFWKQWGLLMTPPW